MPLRQLSLDEIARRAAVSRSTIHLIYRSRAEFFVAMAKDTFERSGFDDVAAALEHADALQAFEGALASLMRFYGTDFPVHRAFVALAALDPDVNHALGDLHRLRNEHSEYLAQRLIDEGHVAGGLNREEAADVICLVLAFETFCDLRVLRALSDEQIGERLMGMARRTLGLR
jgi:AcrR family transcriptional regulator